jgi:hypothetical protein
MFSKEELRDQYDKDIASLSGRYRAAKDRMDAKGFPYYGVFRERYANHLSSFKNMQKRVKDLGFDCDFEHSINGFIEFLVYLGDVPDGIGRPSIGRYDHSKGYVKGNFRWESLSENSAEVGRRRKHKRGEEASKAVLKNGEVRAMRLFRDALLEEGWSLRKVGRALKGALEANGMKSSITNLYYILSDKTFKEE